MGKGRPPHRLIPTEQQKKRGNPGYFAGEPLRLLECYLSKYTSSFGNRDPFWTKFRAEWTLQYPPLQTDEEKGATAHVIEKYNLDRAGRKKKGDVRKKGGAVEKDIPITPVDLAIPTVAAPNYPLVPYLPVIDVSVVASTPSLPSARPSETTDKGKGKFPASERTEEENALVARAASKEKIDSWFANHANKEKAVNQSDVKDILKGLDTASTPSAPQLLPEHKFYQKHPEFKDKVTAAYKDEYSEGKRFDPDRLHKTVAVAKCLFEAEDSETRERIQKEASEEHQRQREEFQKLLDADPTDSSRIERYRAQLGAAFHPIMEHAAKMSNTRMCLTIIGEGETDNKLFVSCVQIGSTPEPNPKKFHEWDQIGFQMSHVRSFAEFVKACVRLEKGLEAYPPQYSSAMPLVDTILPFTLEPEEQPVAEAGPSKPKHKPERQFSTSKRSKRSKRKGQKAKADESSAESSDQSESEEDEFSGDSSDDEEDELQEEPTPPSTPKLKRGYKLNQYLEKELTEMSVSDKRRKMGQLAKLLRDDFDQENILARNRHLQKEAGLSDAVAMLNHAMEAANAEKGKGKQKGKARAKDGNGKEKGKEKETAELRRSTRHAAKDSSRAVHTHEEGHITANVDSVGNDVPMSAIAGDVSVADADVPMAVDKAHVFVPNDLPVPPNATMKLLILRSLIPHLPKDLEEAKDSDVIAMCYHDKTWTPELSSPEAWETWNGILDTVTQRHPTETEQQYVDKVVKYGKKGTEALYRALAHVMEHVVMDPDMLEGKIDRIIAAIEKK
ncbi:hypothetical protein VKT23_009065 [Stygiomarasmius scandens]|uniref:Uncharacterized protein n=1 Tax=Marasmiellus scandens TaxID=2682957 RepID=A0ABR1JGA9_9AGAR